MKILITILTILTFGVIITQIVLFKQFAAKKNKPAINLPEEYHLISQNSHSPDTLIAFRRNDTLCFQFTATAKKYGANHH